METKKTVFVGLDILKFLFSFVIIKIHTDVFLPIKGNEYIDILTQVAVPLYFTISGFLFEAKFQNSKTYQDSLISQLKQYTGKYLSLFLIWTIIYLPFAYYHHLQDNDFGPSTITIIKNIILLGQNYMSWSLWYLLSLAISLVYLLVFRYFVKKDYLMMIFGLCLGASAIWLHELTHWAGIRVYLSGVGFITTGIIAYHLRSHGLTLSFLLSGLTFIGLYCNQLILILYSLALLLCVLGTARSSLSSPLFTWLRKASTLIYLSHLFIIAIFNLNFEFHCTPLSFYILISVCTLAFAALVIEIQKYPHFSFLHYIF